MSIRNVTSMVTVGRFLELSVPTTDIRESLEFYLRLGFTEIPTNDIRSHYYAAVSDGRIVIGLHGGHVAEPTLTFVQPNVAQRVQALIDAGTEPLFQRLGGDSFNEAGLAGPDGHMIMMIEARTFSQSDLGSLPASIIGRCSSIVLRSLDLDRSTVFWEAAGFTLDNESVTTRSLIAAGIAVRLDENQRAADPVLHYAQNDFELSRAALDSANIETQHTTEGLLLRTPEGTRIEVA